MKKLLLCLTMFCLIFTMSGCKPDLSELNSNERLAVEAIREFNAKGGNYDGKKLIVGCNDENLFTESTFSFVYMRDYDYVYYDNEFYSVDECDEVCNDINYEFKKIDMDDYDDHNEYFDDYNAIKNQIPDYKWDIYTIYSKYVCGYELGNDVFNSAVTLVEYENIKQYI